MRKCLALNDLPEILDVSHVKDYLRIGKNDAYNLCHSGQFDILRIGKKRIKIRKDAFIEWLTGQKAEATAIRKID